MTQAQNQDQLRELQNTVEIIGTLKTKDLQIKVSKKGNQYVSGKLVVITKVDNKINEQNIKVMVMGTSKLFKGVETVMNEYKSIDENGTGERIKITGSLELNEYYNSKGELVQFNQVKGVFFNRLDETNDQPDKAIATIETVVTGFEEKLDKDRLPTGSYNIKGFTVAWGNDVVELKNTIVSSDLAQSFMNLYQAGSTGQLTFKLNNYVEVEENAVEVPVTVSHGFGSTETAEGGSNVIRNFVNNIEVIGGGMPFFGTKEYTPEEIQKAQQVRALKLQTMQEPAPTTPNVGFPPVTDDQLPNGMTPPPAPNPQDMPDF